MRSMYLMPTTYCIYILTHTIYYTLHISYHIHTISYTLIQCEGDLGDAGQSARDRSAGGQGVPIRRPKTRYIYTCMIQCVYSV